MRAILPKTALTTLLGLTLLVASYRERPQPLTRAVAPPAPVPRPDITFAVERWQDAVAELKPLFPQHWREIALDHAAIRLNPNWPAYDAMAKAGCLHLVTARAEGALIGYHLAFVHPHLHYLESLTAQSDVFWIHPAYRKGRTGIKLFRFVEADLKAKGVQKIFTGSKVHFDLSRLFEYLGYRKTEVIYTKLL